MLLCLCFTACPASPTPATLLQLYHEEVQYALDGGAVQCTKCLREVVGAHYQNEEPGFPTVVLCMTCCWEEQILQTAGALGARVHWWAVGLCRLNGWPGRREGGWLAGS